MDRMIYTAMAGARQTMHRQATNNHNLANVDTTGFRAAIDALESMPIYGPGHPSRVHVTDRSAGADLTPGAIRTTGDPLHVAVRGQGFIAVQDVDGEEAWTRDGDLRVSALGLLETGAGLPVLGEGGPITVSPYQELSIGADGTISIRPLGQGAGGLAVLDRIRLVNPDPASLTRNERGLFTSDVEAPPDAAVTLQNGALETSNVDRMGAMVTMIELARRFETQINLLKNAEETDSAATSLLRSES